jgi:hypothetical protein
MEKKMAAAAGATLSQKLESAEAFGGREQMPRAINIAAPQAVKPSAQRESKIENTGFSIAELPDYRNVDSSGFLTDVWNAFKDDTKRIWRERNISEEKL